MHQYQDLFEEIAYHLMEDEKPSDYLTNLQDNHIFMNENPFTMLSDLKGVGQTPIHHPEGSVWNHTLLVVDQAAMRKGMSENPQVFMWVALLHDIGKKDTTRVRKGKITSYDHDKVGAKQVVDFLKEFSDDKAFVNQVAHMVRWHMQILFVVNNAQFADISEMKKQVSVKEIALFGLCDRLGRGKVNEKEEKENVRIFLEKCQKK